jgi:predicted transcriptional regulator
VTQSSVPQPRHVRHSTRWQARLDGETDGKLEELARTFHKKRGAVLRYVMQWGLTHGWEGPIDRSVPAAVHLVPLLLEPALLQQVQEAAAVHEASIAAWLRHALRRVTPEDFPASWRTGETAMRFHDSRQYGKRFMLRVDEQTWQSLESLADHFKQSHAEVIRQLIGQARPEDFPRSWHSEAEERRYRRPGNQKGRAIDM